MEDFTPSTFSTCTTQNDFVIHILTATKQFRACIVIRFE
jgi:hypothetical protein